MEMDQNLTEGDLARKFVATWHLNVSERRALPSGSLPGSLLVAEICAAVEAKGWYPTDWRPADGFDGGLIELIGANRCKVYWKVECGVSRFALKEVNECDSLPEAARRYAVRFFGTNFDGIPIDWNR